MGTNEMPPMGVARTAEGSGRMEKWGEAGVGAEGRRLRVGVATGMEERRGCVAEERSRRGEESPGILTFLGSRKSFSVGLGAVTRFTPREVDLCEDIDYYLLLLLLLMNYYLK